MDHIRESDVRQIATFSRELICSDQPWAASWQTILEQMLPWLEADVGLAAVFRFQPGDQRPHLIDVVDTGWAEPAAQKVMRRFLRTGPLTTNPVTHVFTTSRKRLQTARREDVVPDDQWYDSPYFNAVRKTARLDHCVYSQVVLPQGHLAVIGLYRQTGAAPFPKRTCLMLDLMHDATGSHHKVALTRNGHALSTRAELSPRLQQTLTHLLSGASEPQIAELLGLSQHTVHNYVKTLYRKFDVNSRPELMAKFVGPSPDDKPTAD